MSGVTVVIDDQRSSVFIEVYMEETDAGKLIGSFAPLR